MNDRLEALRQRVVDGGHKAFRQAVTVEVASEQQAEGLSWMQTAARVVTRMCRAEQPVILPGERIVFQRTVPAVCGTPAPQAFLDRCAADGIQIGWGVANICADWAMTLSQGLAGRRAVALETRQRLAADSEAVEFLDAAIEAIDAVLDLAGRYASQADRVGRPDLAEMLRHVPAGRPHSFHQALQSLRMLQASLWLCGTEHVGFGRFDQYLWPYLQADLAGGRITLEQARELVAEFFISLNKDSDIHPGVQAGDNGQSLMLGGVTPDGRDAVNPLTWIVLQASCDVNMIDPKINLRVGRDTDLSLLTEAAKLTRKGLGFPQYSNDDVVIAALVAHGYALEDARDYTVAACWEFIIPGRGMDVPNINALSFPAAVDRAIREGLAAGETFESILARTQTNVARQVDTYVQAKCGPKYWPPSPYYSVLMTGCLECGKDVSSGGARYYNFGIHGSGASNAADALAAVRQVIFEEESVTPARLLAALESNFENDLPLREQLATQAPRVGNNDARVDALLTKLFDWFADACEAAGDNGRGGIIRPGTGSAMYYVWLVRGPEGMLEPTVGATADGRREGEFIASSLAPSPGAAVRGPLSVLQSFSGIDYSRVCNGGPITMELSETVFRNTEGLEKVAMLVRTFARLGCQQLQLNTLNPQTLRDAKAHPERHRNLIVRVWGWSGYFCELQEPYQDHILARHVYGMD